MIIKMSVIIYLPIQFYKKKHYCELYGEVMIEHKNVSYFILTDDDSNAHDMRKLGEIRSSKNKAIYQFSINFTYDSAYTNIQLSHLRPAGKNNVLLLLYDSKDFYDININSSLTYFNKVVLLKKFVGNILFDKKSFTGYIIIQNFYEIFCFICENSLYKCGIASELLRSTMLWDHFRSWRETLQASMHERSRKWTILLDMFIGMALLLYFWYYDDPSQYLINLSNQIISQLRKLLSSLKGSPGGLKLNDQLNNFFLDCFSYHVDLWSTFLEIIFPVIRYLFIPFSVIGCLGLSFQLAMLSDLIVLLSLHAHCFYIYTAIFYNIEISGMTALWNVVLGRRKNVIKGRVESHDYQNRQLFVAVLLFTIFLFLLPTIMTYYVVFAALKLCIFVITLILTSIRRYILILPYYPIALWAIGRLKENIEIKLITTMTKPRLPPISVFILQAKKSSPWSIEFVQSWNKLSPDHFLSTTEFLIAILKGQMMGFTQPKTMSA